MKKSDALILINLEKKTYIFQDDIYFYCFFLEIVENYYRKLYNSLLFGERKLAEDIEIKTRDPCRNLNYTD